MNELWVDPTCSRSLALAARVVAAGLEVEWLTADLPAEPLPPEGHPKRAHALIDQRRWLERAGVSEPGWPFPDPTPAPARARDSGVFALPMLVIDGRRYWGPERFAAAMASLGRAPLPTPTGPGLLFHDFASPYSYLGTVPVLDRGFTLKPMLLGAVFRGIGTPMVPIHTFSPERQAWSSWDLAHLAELRGLPFRFPDAFPVRTVTALRLAILDPGLTRPLYDAVWGRGMDIGDDDVVAEVLREAGRPADLLERASEARDVLRENTELAVSLGVPGAPTYIVDDQVYWGGDRLDLL